MPGHRVLFLRVVVCVKVSQSFPLFGYFLVLQWLPSRCFSGAVVISRLPSCKSLQAKFQIWGLEEHRLNLVDP